MYHNIKILTFTIIVFFVGIHISISQFSNDFSVAIIGDSQRLTYGFGGRDVNTQQARFNALTKWIADHVDSLNIIFVSHVGDVVNNENQPSQWSIATEAMAKIRDAGIPWGIAPGNHDDANGYSYYNNHFPVTWWDSASWFGGSYPNGESQNQYQLFSYGENQFLWLHLENQVNLVPQSVAWAQGIIDQHPGVMTIVTTHDYTSERGFDSDGEQLWNQLIKINDQIFLVFCGHQFGVSYIQRDNDAGNIVHNVLVDYQDENPDSLQGATRWFEIDIASNKVFANSINPYEDKLIIDPIRPNSFQGWVSTQAQNDPTTAHHENKFEVQDFFRTPLKVPVIRNELRGRYSSFQDAVFYDLKGRDRTLETQLNSSLSTSEINYKTKYTNVFLVRFKDGGKKILMGNYPVPLD